MDDKAFEESIKNFEFYLMKFSEDGYKMLSSLTSEQKEKVCDEIIRIIEEAHVFLDKLEIV